MKRRDAIKLMTGLLVGGITSCTPSREDFITGNDPDALTIEQRRRNASGSSGSIAHRGVEIPVQDPHLVVPDYFSELLKEKENMINDAMFKAGHGTAAFIFFTDAHWGVNQKHSPALINHLIGNTPLRTVLFGGDVITTSFQNPDDALKLGADFQDAFRFLGANMISLYGNHDNNSSSQLKLPERHLSEEQIFTFLQAQMLDNPDIHYGNYYNFYCDIPSARTRILCLDTGRFYEPVFRGPLFSTLQYVIDELNRVPEGWDVIVAGHMWASLRKKGDLQECYIPDFLSVYLSVFDAFNAREKGVAKFQTNKLEYDFSACFGKILFCLGGHNHTDCVLSSARGIPVLICSTDGQRPINKAPATTGTINEQCVSAVVVDKQSHLLKVFRIGRGSDAEIEMWHEGKSS